MRLAKVIKMGIWLLVGVMWMKWNSKSCSLSVWISYGAHNYEMLSIILLTVLGWHNRLTKSQMFSLVSVVRLKEIALPSSEEIAGYETKD